MDEKFAYYGLRPCGHAVAGIVEDKRFAKDLGEFFISAAERGLTVERRSCDSNTAIFDCDCGKPKLPLFSTPAPDSPP